MVIFPYLGIQFLIQIFLVIAKALKFSIIRSSSSSCSIGNAVVVVPAAVVKAIVHGTGYL